MNQEYCIFTQEIVNKSRKGDIIIYDLDLYEKKITIAYCANCFKKFINTAPHIIKGHILNNKWPNIALFIADDCNNKETINGGEKIIYNDFITSIDFPDNPERKLNNLFLSLYKKQTSDGANILIDLNQKSIIYKNYFANDKEFNLYFKTIEENELIKVEHETFDIKKLIINLTMKGLMKTIELNKSGLTSNTCFIAMAFDEKTREIGNAIKRAINKSGYDVFIVNEKYIRSDQTIPDAILSGIKQSKFCVADFTLHRKGVYFESGFALGMGKQVIYTCKADDFENAHFDIKQLQHIIYKDENELEEALFHKIKAWIS